LATTTKWRDMALDKSILVLRDMTSCRLVKRMLIEPWKYGHQANLKQIVTIYQQTWRNIPDDFNHKRLCVNLKYRIVQCQSRSKNSIRLPICRKPLGRCWRIIKWQSHVAVLRGLRHVLTWISWHALLNKLLEAASVFSLYHLMFNVRTFTVEFDWHAQAAVHTCRDQTFRTWTATKKKERGRGC
jgi:hypothetical protein